MKRYIPILVAILIPLLNAAVMACPFCKDSTAMDASTDALPPAAGGYNVSIYFMLGGVIAVMGFVAFTVVKGIRGSEAAARVRLPQPPTF